MVTGLVPEPDSSDFLIFFEVRDDLEYLSSGSSKMSWQL